MRGREVWEVRGNEGRKNVGSGRKSGGNKKRGSMGSATRKIQVKVRVGEKRWYWK